MYVHPHACSGCRHRCSMQSSVRVQAPMLNVVVALGTPNRDDYIRHHGAQHAYQPGRLLSVRGPSVCLCHLDGEDFTVVDRKIFSVQVAQTDRRPHRCLM